MNHTGRRPHQRPHIAPKRRHAGPFQTQTPSPQRRRVLHPVAFSGGVRISGSAAADQLAALRAAVVQRHPVDFELGADSGAGGGWGTAGVGDV